MLTYFLAGLPLAITGFLLHVWLTDPTYRRQRQDRRYARQHRIRSTR